MACYYCGRHCRFQCDAIDGGGVCGREICENHSVPEFAEGEKAQFTLCKDHAHLQHRPGEPIREYFARMEREANERKSVIKYGALAQINAAALALGRPPCNCGGDPGPRSPHRRDGTPILGNPTRLYGNLFEYDNTPLSETERRAIGTDGKESNWTPNEGRAMRVAYRDEPAIGITVNLIRSWKRGEITPVSSASSGLKDYVLNHVWTVFEQLPFASRVLLVRGEYTQSVPFLLIVTAAGRWFDVLAREVVVS